jgi:hypothetical protein
MYLLSMTSLKSAGSIASGLISLPAVVLVDASPMEVEVEAEPGELEVVELSPTPVVVVDPPQPAATIDAVTTMSIPSAGHSGRRNLRGDLRSLVDPMSSSPKTWCVHLRDCRVRVTRYYARLAGAYENTMRD